MGLERRDHLETAMASLAGLGGLCRLLLLRVHQVKARTTLNGLVEPMGEEIMEIMDGIKRAQEAHAALWEDDRLWVDGFME